MSACKGEGGVKAVTLHSAPSADVGSTGSFFALVAAESLPPPCVRRREAMACFRLTSGPCHVSRVTCHVSCSSSLHTSLPLRTAPHTARTTLPPCPLADPCPHGCSSITSASSSHVIPAFKHNHFQTRLTLERVVVIAVITHQQERRQTAAAGAG